MIDSIISDAISVFVGIMIILIVYNIAAGLLGWKTLGFRDLIDMFKE